MALTTSQRIFAQKARAAMAEFYADPENERAYQEWLKEREEKAKKEAEQEQEGKQCPE